jgi:exodeoxyribonuclease V beta subunit
MTGTAFNPLTMPLTGVHSISASAGTGKTYAITTLYLRFLLDPATQCSVDSILVTTFTEAATAELKDRLRSRLKEALRLLERCASAADAESLAAEGRADAIVVELLHAVGGWNEDCGQRVRERLEDALLSFDQAPVYTIHGFCNRILQDLVFETGSRFDAELVTSTKPLLDEAVCDFVARWWTTPDAPLAGWLKLDGTLLKSMANVAFQAIENPGVTVIPDGLDLEELLRSDLPARFLECVEGLEHTWTTSGEEAIELLRTAVSNGVMNGNKYGRPGQIDRAVEHLQSVIDYRDPDLFQLDDSKAGPTQQRLTQTAVEGGAKKGQLAPRHELFERYEAVVEVAQQMSGHRDQIRAAMLARLVESVREQVERRKRESGVMSFSDLLHQVDRALTGERNQFVLDALRDRYQIAMVDEFQDTDPVQYRIFRQVFVDGAPQTADGRAFVMIGDPKQSIYRFRGADIHACLQAIRETDVANRHQMGMNWRSDRSLVNAVQATFASAADPFLTEEIPLPDIEARFDDRMRDAPAFSVTVVPNPFATEKKREASKADALQRVAHRVADDIVTRLNSDLQIFDLSNADAGRQIEPRDIAILCRAGHELRLIHEQLADRGVPAVLQTEESVFDSPEAAALAHVLRAVLSAGSHASMACALQTSVFGFDADRLDSLQHDEPALSGWIEQFHGWRDCWTHEGFVVMWSRLLDEQGTVARLAGQMTGERRVTNYLHLGELLHNQAEAAHDGPDELLRWLNQMVGEPDRREGDESQLRLETDSAAVQLCTIHKSKGLEYAIVYCPTLWSVRRRRNKNEPDAVLARLDADNQPLPAHELDVGSELIEARRQQDQDAQRAEDRRLLYVALTRARHQCNIYWASVEGAGTSALGHFMLSGDSKLDDSALEDRIGRWLQELGVDRVELRGSQLLSALPDSGRYAARRSDKRQLACRPVKRPVIRSLLQTSFTALARSATEHHPEEVADRDAVSAPRSGIEDLSREAAADALVPLAGLTGGWQLGEVVHQVFEDILGLGGFADAEESAVREAVRNCLQPEMKRHQIDMDWRDALTTSIALSLTQPLALQADTGIPTCRLLAIEHARLTCELPFLLRLRLTGTATESDAFVAAFEGSTQAWIRQYADRVRGMSVSGLRGFLVGFIDLVFEHGGRWFILDYKTNNLGPTRGDYSGDRLRQSMIEHDYILQYHLYAVALDAFLRLRLPGYRYDDHFGGVIYLFVRAVRPDAESLDGLFFDRPDGAVIRELAEAITGDEVATGSDTVTGNPVPIEGRT